MQEIKCPKCGEVFQVDESGYAAIVKQVRDKEFEQELHARHEQFEQEKDAAVELARSEAEKHIASLKAQLSAGEDRQKLAVIEATSERDKTIAEKDAEILTLRSSLEKSASDAALKEQELKNGYEERLKEKDAQIDYYKDFKARQSTKMVGESLEQHCETEFNRLRMTGFKNAYFEKDNDARTGSKGDYIFRDYGDDGTEYISIMFEMKNESDTTSTKHKNEDFFKELDKDRREKNCEYAVLVSLLEPDSELYNAGIVDVSHKYEKMYVIRPQFFIPMITLLRNAATNALSYRQELSIMRAQNIDITHFEENMNEFKEKFAKNYELASRKFKTAIDEIDKTIDHLQKTKEALLSSENNLRLANNKAEDLTIKRLTKNAPSVREAFEALHGEDKD
ncbi:MAG: DUF2130 domain-containing protein [Lachnospiraceae bacterium]|nr:DUF2130 domain-containing protein [Lachnospiraceae bacterium]